MFDPYCSKRRASPTQLGRTSLLLLLVALGLLLGVLYFASRGKPAGSGAPQPVSENAAGPEVRNAALESAPPSAERTAPANGPEPMRFNGRGRIRGSVDTSAGTAFPRSFSIIASPSRTLPGRESAEQRRVECSDTQEFELPDLPLGGYDVRCEAPGMNSLALPVLLERGSADPYVMLQLTPAGRLDGEVVDADLYPIEGLAIALQPLGAAAAARRETRTDAAGRFAFDAVLDGEYRLLFGAPHSQVAPPRELVFQAPGFSFPRIVIADLHSVTVRVVDSARMPLQGARVHGSGSQGGLFDGTTDALGVFHARHLPAGRVRFRAELEGYGQAFQVLDIGPLRQRELELELHP
ncbi:MAG: carboxypeptidase regulatory-like domain-containing protein [Planctomycetes bacterium]|nr:carboxypeptidase regulatory-like domain-containing protein [Planctomycetota bacterium]